MARRSPARPAAVLLRARGIRAILAAAEMTVDNIVRVTSYLRDASFAEANAAARVVALNGRAVPTTAIVVETLDRDWLIEIEVIAAGCPELTDVWFAGRVLAQSAQSDSRSRR